MLVKQKRMLNSTNLKTHHVSHSLIENLNNNNSKNHILVDVISFKDLVEQLNLKNIHILKLDIEGSEIDVLKIFFDKS